MEQAAAVVVKAPIADAMPAASSALAPMAVVVADDGIGQTK